MDAIRNNGRTQRSHDRFIQHQHPGLHTWGAARRGAARPGQVRTEATKEQTPVPGQALPAPGSPGPHSTPPGAPHPSGEGSTPRLRTVASPTTQRGSACCRAALVLLGASFCSLEHVREAAFLRRRARALPQNPPASRPPRALPP